MARPDLAGQMALHAMDGNVKLQAMGAPRQYSAKPGRCTLISVCGLGAKSCSEKTEKATKSLAYNPLSRSGKDQQQQYFKPERQIENASTTSLAYRTRGPDVRCDNVAGHAINIAKPCFLTTATQDAPRLSLATIPACGVHNDAVVCVCVCACASVCV